MRKLFISITTLGMLSSSIVPAFAIDQGAVNTGGIRNTIVNKVTSASHEAKIETRLQTRGGNEIDKRIASLEEAITRVKSMSRLTDDQKNQLISELQSTEDSLKALLTKITGDTSTTETKSDVQSITQAYRVYAVFLPKERIIAAADSLTKTATLLSDLVTKLQTRIQKEKDAGQDVTNLTTSLKDMQTKITDAKTQAQNAINAVSSLTPSGFPDNRSTIKSAETMLKTGRQDLLAAFTDAKTIRKGLKPAEGNNASASAQEK